MTDENNKDQKVEYAFVVLKQEDGRISIGNIDSVEAHRQPSLDDVYSALKVVERDITVQHTTISILSALQQASNGGQQPSQTPSGIVVPQPSKKFTKITRD